VSLVINRPSAPVNKIRTTNELSFSIAPRLSAIVAAPVLGQPGNFTLMLTCSPEVHPEQRVTLLFGGSETPAEPHAVQTGSLAFQLRDVAAGDYFLRLRVDGVDSLLVNYGETPPVFDPNQKVTIP
jgi:hypothetical protein